jgi:threonine synthase
MYYSTNGRSPLVSFREALFKGQPVDGGLYMPSRIPRLSAEQLWALKGRPYAEVAYGVLHPFLVGEVPDEVLWEITQKAYNFPVPVERVTDRCHIIRLDQGPSASFKDFAARFLALIMEHFAGQEQEHRVVLVATSGDTGSAIANAFHQKQGLSVLVLYPKEEISQMQAKQINTLGGNVVAVAARAKFDQLQSMAMRAFEDPELAHLRLTSANSINWGRLLPQITYHFFSYLTVAEEINEPIIDSVASGNFGNVTADFLTKRMGKPLERIIVATNENDEFPAFLETGIYRPIIPSKACLSNAMNVGNPSNLRRLFDLYGGRIDRTGRIWKMPDLNEMRKDAVGYSISDHLTRLTIQAVYERYGLMLEPHGAVAWAALMRYLTDRRDSPLAVATETAHPAKFPEILAQLGIRPDPPQALKGLDKKESKAIEISGKYDELKEVLLHHVASMR